MKTKFWRDSAKCSTATAGLFDPPSVEDNPRQRIEQAQQVCRTCPVKDVCFDEAVRDGDSGVRGGELLDNGRVTRKPGEHIARGPAYQVERLHRLERILALAGQGHRARYIAEELGVSRQSVESDLRRYLPRAA